MNQGTIWALLMQKKRHRKSHAWAPLRKHLLQSVICSIPIPGTLQQSIILLRPFLGNTPTECNRGLEYQ